MKSTNSVEKIPFGTLIVDQLLKVASVQEAIKTALPKHAGLQKTLDGNYEVVDLRRAK